MANWFRTGEKIRTVIGGPILIVVSSKDTRTFVKWWNGSKLEYTTFENYNLTDCLYNPEDPE